jgi:hypothetical protein
MEGRGSIQTRLVKGFSGIPCPILSYLNNIRARNNLPRIKVTANKCMIGHTLINNDIDYLTILAALPGILHLRVISAVLSPI